MKKSKFRVKKIFLPFLPLFFTVGWISCNHTKNAETSSSELVYKDTAFVQEVHDAFKISDQASDNEVRSIAVDHESTIWIATASGVFCKKSGTRVWEPVITGDDRGPAYSVGVIQNGDVLLGTWDGLYRYTHHELKKETGIEAPVSVICKDSIGAYAMGPNGIWRILDQTWVKQEYNTSRAIRDAVVDKDRSLWIATDAGLYQCLGGKLTLFQDVSELISCYAKALSVDPAGKLWVGVMGGVSFRDK